MPEAAAPRQRLLIDAGNSRLKWLRTSGRQLLLEQHGACHHQHAAPVEQQPDRVDEIIIVSVVDLPWAQRLTELFPALDPLPPIRHLTSQTQHPLLRNAYPQAEKLGSDRWYAMLGARSGCREALCVADLGTATTLDAIDASGQHLGGWILPGLGTSRRALHHAGQQLTDSAAGQILPFATNTADAIASGTAHAQNAAIVAFLRQMQRQAPESVRLFLTGGHAQALLSLLSYEAVLDPWLIFRGMLAQLDP